MTDKQMKFKPGDKVVVIAADWFGVGTRLQVVESPAGTMHSDEYIWTLNPNGEDPDPWMENELEHEYIYDSRLYKALNEG